MTRWIPRRPATVALILLLVASLAGNLFLYGKASRPLFDEYDRPLIERTIALSPEMHSDAARAAAFPIVMRWGRRTCVELRRYDRMGYSGACFDSQGKLIEQAAGVVN